MNYIGKSLIFIGTLLVLVGIFFTLQANGNAGIFSWFGRLPGDVAIQKKNFSFLFPITSCIIISVILSIVFFLFFRQK